MVRIELVVSMRHARARSAVTRRPEGLQAAVRISLREPARYVERIAHELEHVLEQVEGLDLDAAVADRRAGVARLAEGVFESERAQRVGRQAALEVAGGRR